MIYCVVPEELAPELYDRLAAYYADDGNVQVIIDRRRSNVATAIRAVRPVASSASSATVGAPVFPATSRSSTLRAPPPLSPTTRRRVRVIVHVDGGARGNPGPAAAAAVVSDADGQVLDEAAEVLGVATNNVAEYRGLLLGLQRARELGATDIEVVNDSELVAKQINGEYKVKHADMKPLHRAATEVLEGFDRWTMRSVPRAQNAHADALVNQALDARDD